MPITLYPQDKELELSLLQSTVHDLRQQLEDSEKSRSQLRQTLVELEQGRQSVDALEAVLREKEREIVKLKAAEKHKVMHLLLVFDCALTCSCC